MAKHKLPFLILSAAAFLFVTALFLCLFVRVKRLENALAKFSAPTEEPAQSGNEPVEEESLSSIPTAIRFEAESSPLLTPQTTLTVTLPRVTRFKDRLVLDIVANADQASSYAAFVPEDKFILIRPEGGDLYAIDVAGGFSSIPPGGSVSGKLTFDFTENDTRIIFRIETQGGAEYYEFNFETSTYREARLG